MTSSYEQHVLAWLQRLLLEREIGQGAKRITIDEVHLEQELPKGDQVVILFREALRPNCLFGFRIQAREPIPPDYPDWRWAENDNPEGEGPQVDADMIFARFQEKIEAADMGLPKNCNPDSITWI